MKPPADNVFAPLGLDSFTQPVPGLTPWVTFFRHGVTATLRGRVGAIPRPCLAWTLCALLVCMLAHAAVAQIISGSGGGIGTGYPSGQESAPGGAPGVPGPSATPNVSPTAKATQPVRYSISGTVVNAVTGEPVAHALVTGAQVAFTDENGQFTLKGVPEGSYGLQVFRPGYTSAYGGGATPTIAKAGPDSTPVKVQLMPESLIKGRVVDEQGDGVPSAMVTARCTRIVDGRKQWQECSSANTDEDGDFRLPHLIAGSYYLVASAMFAWQVQRVTNPAEPPTSYRPAYYPQLRDGSGRGTLELGAGAKEEVKLTLQRVRSYNVYGMVTGISGNRQAAVQLLDQSGEPLPTNSEVEAESGTFVVHNVPAGSYRLRAFSMEQDGARRAAEVPITVAQDLTDLAIALRPAITIPVSTHLEATHENSANYMGTMSINGVALPPNTPVVTVCLTNVDRANATQCSMTEVKDGVPITELRGVPPGRYRVRVTSLGMVYPSAITYDGSDVMNGELALKPGVEAATLKITLRDDEAQLKCSLQTADDSTNARLLVVSDSGRWSTMQFLIGKRETLLMVPPGDYKVYAFDRADDLEYANADAMSEYATAAVPLTVQPNEQRSLKLDLITRGGN
jgi:Carboxypeptidase regulatory-like domain